MEKSAAAPQQALQQASDALKEEAYLAKIAAVEAEERALSAERLVQQLRSDVGMLRVQAQAANAAPDLERRCKEVPTAPCNVNFHCLTILQLICFLGAYLCSPHLRAWTADRLRTYFIRSRSSSSRWLARRQQRSCRWNMS